MDDDIRIAIYVIAVFFIILTIIGGYSIVDKHDENVAMGQMICDEKDLGEFKEFNIIQNKVYCYEKEELIPFDGGNIVVVSNKGDY